MNLCDENRIITIEKAKQALINGTNIEDSPEEMKVLDNILFRCWQMGWLDRYDPQMPSNTSNALEALNSVNATQSNALDCISRAKAIEALDKRFDSIPMEQTSEILMLRKDLRNLPPAGPQIIHCKDCKYFKQVFASNDNDGLCAHWHTKWDARTSPKGYCSYAERKQNDTERC